MYLDIVHSCMIAVYDRGFDQDLSPSLCPQLVRAGRMHARRNANRLHRSGLVGSRTFGAGEDRKVRARRMPLSWILGLDAALQPCNR